AVGLTRQPASHYFFFSSRRRHTRWPRDWSSDVCSSDLKAQLLHQSGLGLEPALAEGGERAGCAREFTHQHARTQLRETRAMPLDRGENPGDLVAEGHGNGLLQVAAPDHRRVAVATGELRHRGRDRAEIVLDEHEALANLQ